MEADIYKAGGIVIRSGKTLVARSYGKQHFISPGGKIKKGESARQALVRELNEELRIDVQESDLEPFGTFSAEAAYDLGRTVHIEHFIVKRWRGNIMPDNEIEDVRWISSNIPADVKVGSIFVHEVIPRLKARGLIA